QIPEHGLDERDKFLPPGTRFGKSQRLFKGRKRFALEALLDVHCSQQILDTKIVRRELCCFPEDRNRFIVAPLLPIDYPEFLAYGKSQSAVRCLLEPCIEGCHRVIIPSF